MTLDSKDSDIEQLRSQLQALHIGMDSSSTGSGPGDAEADDGFPGTNSFSARMFIFFFKPFVLNINLLVILSPVTDFALKEKYLSFL